MEKDKLFENTKLFSFEGIINRSDFAVNLVCISAISAFFTIPYMTWLMKQLSTIADYFAINKFFMSAPIFLKFWIILGTFLTCALTVSNIFRRLNDINSDIVDSLNIGISAIIAISAFSFILPIYLSLALDIVTFIIFLFLIFKKGAVTSLKPYDCRKEFNWGAFFGTWFWGLFNKSYIPLLYLILFLTPWSFLFQLYCGLKGNQWAYDNKKWNDVDKFKNSQKKQAIFWSILYCIIFPVLCFTLLFAGFFAIFSNLAKPENAGKLEQLNKTLDEITANSFTSYSVEQNENKFYIDQQKWSSSSFSQKKELLEAAANLAAGKRKQAAAKNRRDNQYFSKMTELPRTKIYSSSNSKLLGEFVMNTKQIEESGNDFSKIMKEVMTAYRFY